jgi:hypothetical protein
LIGSPRFLARLLFKRFGPLDDQTSARLKAATLDQPDIWADCPSPSVCRDTGFKRATLTGSDTHAMGLVVCHNQTPFA